MVAPTFLKNLNIRTRLLLLCLAVAAPLVAMCALVIWKEYQGLSQVAYRATTFHDQVAVRTLQQWVTSELNELQSIAGLPAMTNKNVSLAEQVLAGQCQMEPNCNALALFDLAGQPVAASSQIKDRSRFGSRLVTLDAFHRASLGQPAVSGYAKCPITGLNAILLAQPVFTGRKVTGVLLGSINPKAILQLFSGLTEANGFVVCIVDQDRRVIARTLHNEKFIGHDFSHAKTVTAAGRQRRGVIEVVGIADPTQRTYAFDRCPNTGWLVIVGIPTQAIYGSASERLLILIGSLCVAVGTSIALAYAVTSHFTGPIHELVREAVSIGRGDLSKRVSSTQGGELGLLARAFNQMALNLELNREHKFMVEKISESVRQSLDLTEILNTTVLELGQALSSSRCCLALVDDDQLIGLSGKQLEFNYVWWDPLRLGTSLKNRSVVITEGSILKIILEQGAILSLDVMDDSTFTPLFEQAEDSPEDWESIKSLIACPIVLNKQPIGMILVHQCDRRRVWLDLELELVEAVARHVGLALDHANLFARTRTLAEQEFLINQIVRATRDSLDADTILNTAAQELGKALGVDYCQIAQPRPEAPLVVTHEYNAEGYQSRKGLGLYGSQIDFDPGSENPQELRSVLGIDLSMLESKDELDEGGESSLREAPIAVISDAETDRRTLKFREFIDTLGAKSLMAAPLLRDDRVLGILIIHQCSKSRQWQAGEVRLMAAVADQLSVAVSHAQLFSQVQHQAITDGLTGLYNHIYFKNRLGQELKKAQRKGTDCSLLMLDLDKLKQINDTYGHPVGDAAIRQVATVLKSLLRSGDTAARYGGEEFAVILPETPLSEAVLIADRLRRNVNRTPVPGLGHISTSIGAAAFPLQGVSLEDLIEKADQALYSAKHAGRNRVGVWENPNDPNPSIVLPTGDEPEVVLPTAST